MIRHRHWNNWRPTQAYRSQFWSYILLVALAVRALVAWPSMQFQKLTWDASYNTGVLTFRYMLKKSRQRILVSKRYRFRPINVFVSLCLTASLSKVSHLNFKVHGRWTPSVFLKILSKIAFDNRYLHSRKFCRAKQ